MELQLVTFEQAKKLKDLGFPQGYDDAIYIIRDCYSLDGDYAEDHKEGDLVYYPSGFLQQDWISAPTLDLAAKWLREEKSIPIYPEPYYPNNTLKWVCKAKYYIGKNNWSTSAFDTYEEALSDGIDKVLETL